ncbi:MAG: tyrosine-type recombinase/integrase [Actinomycetota bacterium]
MTIEADQLRGTYLDPSLGRTTLAEFWERFDATALHLRPSTRSLYRSQWRQHIAPVLGAHPLAAITRTDVESFLAFMALNGAQPPTQRATRKLLSRLLAGAVDAGLVGRNVAHGVSTPTVARREMRFLTAIETDRLVEATPERYQALILVAAYGGLRFGELCALRVGRFDALRRRVSIEESIVEVGGKNHAGPTKTSTSRAVKLPGFVAEKLALHLATQPLGSDGLIFTDPQGGPMRRTNFRRRVWLPAVRRAGLEPLRFHDLRHTAAALAIASGAHPKAIQERLGHSTITVTLDRYGHLFPSLDEELAERLDVMARGAAGSRAPSLPPEDRARVIALPVEDREPAADLRS